MDTREFIQASLDRVKLATARVVDGLSHSELAWRPGPECGSIGLILFHMVRSEDTFIQTRIQGKPLVWEAEKWYEKLNLPAAETGSGYTAEQIAAFRVPELNDLTGYAEAVRARTLEYLKGITDAEYTRVITLARLGDIPVGKLLALVVVHLAQHVGEISYLRGMQRGLNK